jgi:glycosyltransferase involved in cell wall biosynthesis
MKSPIVSVVITCYNYAHFLGKAVDSVTVQSFRDFEIIVVNDGSTDNTDEVMQGYSGDANLKYVSQKNAGQAIAKNVGIRNSSGEFIAFLDADDLWTKDKLEKQIPLFSNPQVGVVYSGLQYIDELGQKLDDKRTRRYLVFRSGDVTRYLFFDNFVPFSASIVRRQCFDKVGPFDESLSMGIDWDLWLRMSVYYKFDFVDEPLLIYRKGHAGQMSKRLDERFQCADRITKKFLANHPDSLTKDWIKRVFSYNACNRGNYYGFHERMPDKALKYFLAAIKQNWLNRDAYIGLGKCLFFPFFVKKRNHRR